MEGELPSDPEEVHDLYQQANQLAGLLYSSTVGLQTQLDLAIQEYHMPQHNVHLHLMNDYAAALYFTVPHRFPWTAHGLLMDLMECSWTVHGLFMDCSWTAHGVLMDSMDCSWSPWGVLMESVECSWSPWALWYVWYNLPCRSVIASTFVLGSLTLDFGWTMISFGEIYPL